LRTQGRVGAPQGLDRVRQAGRLDKETRFTALLHHVDFNRPGEAFPALKRDAAPGVDGLTWRDYENDLDSKLADLCDRVHKGGYIARFRRLGSSSRRRRACSGPWRSPPWKTTLALGLDPSIVERAVQEVPNALLTRRTSSGSRTGSAPDAVRMHRPLPETGKWLSSCEAS
jgi:RNA-directed DNA polymerase